MIGHRKELEICLPSISMVPLSQIAISPCMTSTGYLGYPSDLATLLATPVTSLETEADVFAESRRRSQANRALGERIVRLYHANRGMYGSPRIHAALRGEGELCGKKRVAQAHAGTRTECQAT